MENIHGVWISLFDITQPNVLGIYISSIGIEIQRLNYWPLSKWHSSPIYALKLSL